MAGLLLPRVIYGISSIASYTLRQEENKKVFQLNVNRPPVDYMGYVMNKFEHMCEGMGDMVWQDKIFSRKYFGQNILTPSSSCRVENRLLAFHFSAYLLFLLS